MTKRIYETPRLWLTLNDCKIFYDELHSLVDFDEPIPPFETRFPGRLESVLGSVEQYVLGHFVNPTIADAASAYLNQIVRGHVFQNGNKRMGVLFMHIFLIMNGVDVDLNVYEMVRIATYIAVAGETGISIDTTKFAFKQILEKFSFEYKV